MLYAHLVCVERVSEILPTTVSQHASDTLDTLWQKIDEVPIPWDDSINDANKFRRVVVERFEDWLHD
jgi:hypothetical protein